jgi:hypothetical protein
MLQPYEYERSASHLTITFVHAVRGHNYYVSGAVQICVLFDSIVSGSVHAISMTLTFFGFTRIDCTSLYCHDLLNYFISNVLKFSFSRTVICSSE